MKKLLVMILAVASGNLLSFEVLPLSAPPYSPPLQPTIHMPAMQPPDCLEDVEADLMRSAFATQHPTHLCETAHTLEVSGNLRMSELPVLTLLVAAAALDTQESAGAGNYALARWVHARPESDSFFRLDARRALARRSALRARCLDNADVATLGFDLRDGEADIDLTQQVFLCFVHDTACAILPDAYVRASESFARGTATLHSDDARALTLLVLGRSRFPHDVMLLNSLSNLFAGAGPHTLTQDNPTIALYYAQRALELDPASGVLHANIADMYATLEAPEKALDHYRLAQRYGGLPDATQAHVERRLAASNCTIV